MSMKEAYKKKAAAELELAQARLAEFKAKAKSASADLQVNYAKQIEELDNGVGVAKGKLKELGDAGEEAWEKLKDGVESALRSVSASIRDIADKIKH
ncbi:hypothetical protein G9409_07130 [Chlorobium sp. BLA1]|uniref:hypothetical protein n=1 Tax=Candidatus Chlorobium masyuteum TaxID=2716876 RepID=UPI0014230571|nr:hypothetical protein [Candidatus Chlorobium masyuteum]NHQ60364.1 hypothetical protein [Candidatus Chlorobium masyuteum]NTU44064.1 hypothetical protein [Chlorobiaceae bacterium]